jgi:hypothetical protein
MSNILKITGATFLALLLACNSSSDKTRLVGTWQGKRLDNALMDSFFARSQRVIDTLGANHTADENLEFYGTNNMDSMKRALQAQHDSAYVAQANRIKNVNFNFAADKTAYISFDGKATIDTARWTLDDENSLILEDRSWDGNRSVKKMKLIAVSETELKLMVWSNNDSSLITLEKAED